jgi:ANTAR domain-containing protein
MHYALTALSKNASFQTAPRPYLVLDRDWVIRAVNHRYLEVTGQQLDDLLGTFLFTAFPDNPGNETADGSRNLAASLDSVMRSSQRRYMLVQRYDVPRAAPETGFVLKYWSPVNDPIRDDLSGRAVGVLHSVEDVTPVWAPMLGHPAVPAEEAGADADQPADPALRESLIRLAMDRNEMARQQLTLEVTQLQEALESRVIIEQAKGVLMAKEQLPPQAAFELLRRRARSSQRRLRDLAEQIVHAAHGGSASMQDRS